MIAAPCDLLADAGARHGVYQLLRFELAGEGQFSRWLAHGGVKVR